MQMLVADIIVLKILLHPEGIGVGSPCPCVEDSEMKTIWCRMLHSAPNCTRKRKDKKLLTMA